MSQLNSKERPQRGRKQGHCQKRVQLTRSGLNDRSTRSTRSSRYLGASYLKPRIELLVHRGAHAEQVRATDSLLLGDSDANQHLEDRAIAPYKALFTAFGSGTQLFGSRTDISMEFMRVSRAMRRGMLSRLKAPGRCLTVLVPDKGRDGCEGLANMRDLLWEANHEPSQTRDADSAAMIPGLMVIDCFSRRVVVAEQGCHYVALSYVWGSITSHSQDQSFQPDIHAIRLPQTVEDAITVVCMIGMRFLWVDRYCIDDTEPGRKHYTISNMDAVYEAAYLTIIAASGSDGEHGLPTVSRPHPRVALAGADFPPWNCIVSTNFDNLSREQLNMSVWSTRGWTYQEALLSRRRLIFTDDWAIFHCGGHFNGMEDRRIRKNKGIFGHINEYSRRRLTYQSDSLKAFLGVLRSYERLRPPAMHLYGVPFIFDPDGNIRELVWGILWRPTRECALSRIPGLPSWSWAGWSGWSDSDDEADWAFIGSGLNLGPYSWLMGQCPDTAWEGESDIFLQILAEGQLTDISDHFRADQVLVSGEIGTPTPDLYLTAWSTTVTALVSPTLGVCLPSMDLGNSYTILDPAVESLSKGHAKMDGCWSLEWTAAIVCWRPNQRDNTVHRTQSLLLERVGEDTFCRVGILVTDWRKPNRDHHEYASPMGRSFTRKCLRIV